MVNLEAQTPLRQCQGYILVDHWVRGVQAYYCGSVACVLAYHSIAQHNTVQLRPFLKSSTIPFLHNPCVYQHNPTTIDTILFGTNPAIVQSKYKHTIQIQSYNQHNPSTTKSCNCIIQLQSRYPNTINTIQIQQTQSYIPCAKYRNRTIQAQYYNQNTLDRIRTQSTQSILAQMFGTKGVQVIIPVVPQICNLTIQIQLTTSTHNPHKIYSIQQLLCNPAQL